MRKLTKRFKFNLKHRRLRYIGYILNLVVREALFGSKIDVLKAKLTA